MGGPVTLAQARDLPLDHLFVVADAVDTELGVTTSDLLDAEVLTASARNSRCVTVIAEANAWGRTHLVRVLAWDAVHRLITDPEALGGGVRPSILRGFI
jgi:DeoR/GlpR family transcriptional regulator of sugar metabolism